MCRQHIMTRSQVVVVTRYRAAEEARVGLQRRGRTSERSTGDSLHHVEEAVGATRYPTSGKTSSINNDTFSCCIMGCVGCNTSQPSTLLYHSFKPFIATDAS